MRPTLPLRLIALLVVALFGLVACGEATDTANEDDATPEETASPDDAAAGDQQADAEGPLTVYSGRSEDLVGPIIDRFTEETGIEVEVRYGDTAEMAAQILEEGANTPADVYYGQDAGALGALASEGMLRELPDAILDLVEDDRFESPEGTWVGTSGRARTVVYNSGDLSEDDVPSSVFDLTEPEWEGRVGWAPTNGSFQAFVTAMRIEHGDDRTREWLQGMIDNGVRNYESNTPIVEAAARGEIDLGLVNHYYLFRFKAEDPDFPAENAFLSGDVGALINVAGTGIVEGTDQPSAAERFVEFLLSQEAQEYFASETFEYPLISGVAHDERLPDLEEIETPDIDLSDLEDLQGTLELLREVGALE